MKVKPPLAERQQKASFKRLFIPLFLAFILILSVFGYIFAGKSSNDDTSQYQGYSFTKTSQGWKLISAGKTYFFYSLPDQLHDIPLAPLPSASKFYISGQDISFFSSLPYRELTLNLGNAIKLQPACAQDSPGCETYPLKTCADATSNAPVLVYLYAEKSSLEQKENCLQIQGTTDDMIRITDAIILHSLGVL